MNKDILKKLEALSSDQEKKELLEQYFYEKGIELKVELPTESKTNEISNSIDDEEDMLVVK